MGFFKNLKGEVPKGLLAHGLLGRGQIEKVEETGVRVGSEMNPHPVCIFTVQVILDNQDPYEATCRQAIPLEQLPTSQTGKALVAVRVNPNDPEQIAIDLDTDPPVVTVKPEAGRPSAAELITSGTDCRAVIVESQDYNAKSPDGDEIYSFTLTVIVEDRVPYQITVGFPVPAEAIPLLYPGNNLPAKKGTEDNQVVIDWRAALASYTEKKP